MTTSIKASDGKSPDATTPPLHGADGPQAEPRQRRRRGGLLTSLMLVILTCGLTGATALCLAVAGVALAIWPPAAIDAMAERAVWERAAWLAGSLAAALAIWVLVWMSWRAFARARTARCADFMIAALLATWGLYMGLTSPLVGSVG